MEQADAARLRKLADYLVENLKAQRAKRGLTQTQLAKLAALPRSTIANLEVGGSNPTLHVLASLSGALGLSLEELLSAPVARVRVHEARTLAARERGRRSKVKVTELLPEATPGMAFERMSFAPGARLPGVPHHPGTREYLHIAKGKLRLHVAGEAHDLSLGDVATFAGDQPHSYANIGGGEAVGYAVVLLAPLAS
jgi:transcriptional regulator with XRE-family HTH domain